MKTITLCIACPLYIPIPAITEIRPTNKTTAVKVFFMKTALKAKTIEII